jgi:hypothetical protein
MHGENLRKFTETRAAAPRARHVLISLRPSAQQVYWIAHERNNNMNNHLDHFLHSTDVGSGDRIAKSRELNQ